MKNVITKGAEILSLEASPDKSTENIILNEDYAMVVEITEVLYGKVGGFKIWDKDRTKKFYAKLAYTGKLGVPVDSEVSVGSHAVFNRVGDFNSQGTEGFELHTEDASKISFICFIPKNSI